MQACKPAAAILAFLCVVVLLCAGGGAAYAAPVSYWNFDDGTTATDQAGSNDGLSFEGGAGFSADTPTAGGSWSLDLTNGSDYVTLPSVTYGITDEYTISAWVKRSSTGRFFSIIRDLTGGGGDRSGVNLGLSGSEVYTGLISSSTNNNANSGNTYHDMTTTSGVDVAAGTWTHVTARLKDDFITMYVNGVAETVYASGGSTLTTGQLKVLGSDIDFVDDDGSFSGLGADGSSSSTNPHKAQSFYDGLLDEVAVWNQPLNGWQIQGLADGEFSPLSVPNAETFQLVDLSSKFERDTIADTANEPTGNGYRFQSEVFLTDNHPSQVGNDNIPASGILVANGTPYTFGPFGDDQVANNTWIISLGETDSVDVPDRQYSEMSVLFSAVGYNATASDTDGTFTVYYADATSDSFTWDVVDSSGGGLDGLAQSVLGNVDLWDADSGGSLLASDRDLFVQTFSIDVFKFVDRIEFSAVGVVDPGSDAEFGIYAITGRLVPEPGALLIWSLLAGLGIGLGRRRRK